MTLVFITQTGPAKSKKLQTQIRKHVMKDIGKSRRKAGHREKVTPFQFSLEVPNEFETLKTTRLIEPNDSGESALQLEEPHRSSSVDTTPPDNQLGQMIPASEPSFPLPEIDRIWTGRTDPFIKYPIEMSHRTRQLVDHVFDDRYGNTPAFRDAWMPVGILDPATFHQVLSNAALNLASLRAKRWVPETLESMRYHAKAVRSINRRIGNRRDALSDGLLGAVIGFACYYHVIGYQKGWHMHMSGAKEILRLRGGKQVIESNYSLRMILFWVDVGGATTEDGVPYFPPPINLPALPKGITETPFSQQAQAITSTWRHLYPSQTEIMNLMNALQCLIARFKTQVHVTRGAIFRDGIFAGSYILPLQNRLVSLSAPATEVSDSISAKMHAIRLACILFLAEIRRALGIMGVVSTLQVRKLRCFLEMSGPWEDLSVLRMWCLAMGGMESLPGPLKEWFARKLESERTRLGMGWKNVENILREVLWYDDVHHEMFLDLVDGKIKSMLPPSFSKRQFDLYHPVISELKT